MSKKIIICITVLFFSGFMYAKGAFVEVGDPSFFSKGMRLFELKSDSKGNVFAGYVQDGNYSVAKFDGEKWSDVGKRNFTAEIGSVFYTDQETNYISFELDNEGIPYVALSSVKKLDNSFLYLIVMKYDYSDNSWKVIGKTGIADFETNWVSLSFSKENIPYLAFSGCSADVCKDYSETADEEYEYTPSSVMKFNGSEWVYVGEPMFDFNPEQPHYSGSNSISFGSDNTIYLAYNAWYPQSHDVFVTLKKYNGSSWESVSSKIEIKEWPVKVITGDGNTIYVAAANGIVRMENGEWVKIFEYAQSKETSVNVMCAELDSHNTLYASFFEQNQGETINQTIKLKKFIDGSWEDVFSKEKSAYDYFATSLVIDNENNPYIAYFNNDGRIVLMKYDPETGENPDDTDDDVSDEDETADEDKKDSGSSGCGLVVM